MHIKELGHVVLYVSDVECSAVFYRDVLGFHEIRREKRFALFSSGRTHHELLLIGIKSEKAPSKQRPVPGLYHIGLKIGDTPEELKQAYRELRKQNVPIVGTGDHTVTHSLYILDPDENELELYVDVSDIWRTDPLAITGPVRPLDLS